MSACPWTGRETDTFGPIIVPSSLDDVGHDSEPRPLASKWLGLAVATGILLGTLLVGWVYVLDQRDVQATARMAADAHAAPAKAAAAKPVAAPRVPPVAAPSVAAPPAAPAADHAASDALGFIAIPGPAGSRVFEGNALIGIAPMMHVTSVGAHNIRVRAAGSDKMQSFDVHVRAAETSAVVVADTRAPSAAGRAKRPSRGVKASAR